MGGWRVLKLSGKQTGSQRPVLLSKHQFQQNQYTIYLTDLAHIWEEHADRKSIIKRALNDGTSIDPSEGADQLQLLLHHLQNAVNGKSGSLKLQQVKESDSLCLHAIVDLPVPLEPLKWSFTLKQTSSDVLFQQLQIPLFERSFNRQTEVDSLLTHVAERDNVISRLVDKMEASGIDMASVFPGAASLRGSKAFIRESLFRNVSGLRSFDEKEWKAKVDGSRWKTREELLQRIFEPEEAANSADTWILPRDWWQMLQDDDGEDLLFLSIKNSSKNKRLSPPPVQRGESSMLEEDGFQIQDISKLSRNQPTTSKVQVKDSQLAQAKEPSSGESSTEDEDDLDALSSPAQSFTRNPTSPGTPARPSAVPPTRKLGMLGGGTGKGKQLARSPSPTQDSMDIDDYDGSSRLKGSLIEPDSVPVRAPSPPRLKIGRIGGLLSKRPEENKELSLRRSRSQERDDDDDNNTKGKAAEDDDDDPESRPSRPPQRESKSKIPARETSTERADRLRAELKRDLEEKRKAPLKKKRKF